MKVIKPVPEINLLACNFANLVMILGLAVDQITLRTTMISSYFKLINSSVQFRDVDAANFLIDEAGLSLIPMLEFVEHHKIHVGGS